MSCVTGTSFVLVFGGLGIFLVLMGMFVFNAFSGSWFGVAVNRQLLAPKDA